MRTRVLRNKKLSASLKETLSRLTTGESGMMWYRLNDGSRINAVLLYGDNKKLIGWSLLNHCITDLLRADIHVFVTKKNRGSGHGLFLRVESKKQFEKIFKKLYYYNCKKKDYVRC